MNSKRQPQTSVPRTKVTRLPQATDSALFKSLDAWELAAKNQAATLSSKGNIFQRNRYGVRLGVVAAGAAVVATLGTSLVGRTTESVSNTLERNQTPPIPDRNFPYKSFRVGETFTVNGREVTIKTLSEAAIAAHLKTSQGEPIANDAVTQMLTEELNQDYPGVDPSDISPIMDFRLPPEAAIGDLTFPME